MATDPRDIQLTGTQRRLLAKLADNTGRPWTQLLNEVLDRLPTSVLARTNGKSDKEESDKRELGRTLYDAFAEKRLIGCIHSGTGDLSTNPKHMEGFGKDVWPTNSD